VSSEPVVVITGASQSIGAGLVVGYRRLGYAVALGDIRTPLHDPATYAALAKSPPLGRVGEIDDVVKAVLCLENSPFVTGEILHVDGGQSAGH